MICPKCKNDKKFQWMAGIVYCLECSYAGEPHYFRLDEGIEPYNIFRRE